MNRFTSVEMGFKGEAAEVIGRLCDHWQKGPEAVMAGVLGRLGEQLEDCELDPLWFTVEGVQARKVVERGWGVGDMVGIQAGPDTATLYGKVLYVLHKENRVEIELTRSSLAVLEGLGKKPGGKTTFTAGIDKIFEL